MAEINVTPLVDVMLVLLIIFMVTAPALSQTLSMDLPQENKQVPPPREEMTVQVQAGDLFALDGRAMSRAQITTALLAEAARNPELKVNLDVDPNAEYASAMQAMTAVRNAGIEAIGLPQE